MDTSKLSNQELLKLHSEYAQRYNEARKLDKRYYNNKMENVYAGAMETLFRTELNKRGIPTQ